LLHSFEAEFEPFQAEIRQRSEEVEREIGLAKAQADEQERRDAAKHRQNAVSPFAGQQGD